MSDADSLRVAALALVTLVPGAMFGTGLMIAPTVIPLVWPDWKVSAPGWLTDPASNARAEYDPQAVRPPDKGRRRGAGQGAEPVAGVGVEDTGGQVVGVGAAGDAVDEQDGNQATIDDRRPGPIEPPQPGNRVDRPGHEARENIASKVLRHGCPWASWLNEDLRVPGGGRPYAISGFSPEQRPGLSS
jgi:hypothetical protein